jgi:hypothetical protein
MVMVAVCGATTACADSTAPVVQPTLDDALFHVQLADPLSAIAAAELGLPIVVPQIRRVGDCAFSPERERFECPSRVAGDLIIERSYALMDAAGVPLPAWSDRVAAIRLVTDVRDETSRVTSHDEATLDRLQSAQQVLTGRTSMSWTSDGESRSATRTTDLVILSRMVMPGIFPTGSIGLRTSGVTSGATVALTLDGTSVVSMLASGIGGGASLSCTYDLLKPEQPKRCD